jgi:hypothetical protein
VIPIPATIDYDHIANEMYEMVDLLPVLKDNDVVGVVRSGDLLYELSLMIA